MSAPVKISEAASLAMHACLWLSSDVEAYYPTREICDDLRCSQAHLSKVLQALTRADIISSQRGPLGGVRLARPPGKTTFLAIYEAVEGPTSQKKCLLPLEACKGGSCIIGDAIADLNRRFISLLRNTTLADIHNHLKKEKTC